MVLLTLLFYENETVQKSEIYSTMPALSSNILLPYLVMTTPNHLTRNYQSRHLQYCLMTGMGGGGGFT